MNAERPPLPDDAVEKQRGGLGDLVVLDEKFLKLIDNQEGTGDGLGTTGPLVSGHILNAEFSEEIAAAFQFVIEALKHAQAEFTVAFNGDHSRMRQTLGGITFELDALFEIHQVKLDLFGAAP